MKKNTHCFLGLLALSLFTVLLAVPALADPAGKIKIKLTRVFPVPGGRNVEFREWAILNGNGEVTQGIVKSQALGAFPDGRNLWFNGEVRFSSDGLVERGVLEFDTALGVVGTSMNTWFKGGTMVRFSTGTPYPGVIEGVLARQNGWFKSANGGAVVVPMGSRVIFDASGSVVSFAPGAKTTSLLPGKWKIAQPPYSGTLVLTVDGTHVSGNISWDNHPGGTVSGTISADSITFVVSYPSGLQGTYTGKIAADGRRIINGIARGNDNTTASWNAELQVAGTTAAAHRFANGELIRQSGTDPIYIIENGVRRWIPNPETFNAKGYSWGAVKDISAEEMRSVPEGPPLPSVKQ